MEESRRAFIKKTCGLCAGMIGISAVLPLIQGCSTLLTLKTDVVSGNVTVLKSHFSSESPIVLLSPKSREFDIALVSFDDGKFKAFELQCTHETNALVPTKSGFFCNAHGSSFSLEGKVQKPPAKANLREFPVEVNTDAVVVKI